MIQAKPCIDQLKPYINGQHTRDLILNHKKIIKLDSNEATIGPSPLAITAIMNYLQHGPVSWYPDVASTELCEKIATYANLPVNHVLTFNGSDHALETIARTFLQKGDQVIHLTPTYDHFRVYAESCDAELVGICVNTEDELLSSFSAHVSEQTKIFYLVNPNNPTGLLISQDLITTLVSQYPQILFVIDEAYFEFTNVTAASLTTQFSNIIVTRSFSKAFGLASLRCGYLLADPKLCAQINKIRVGKSINALAQAAACATLNDLDYMLRYVEEVQSAKTWLIGNMTRLGITIMNTAANFVLFKVHDPARTMQFLEEHNVFIRDRSHITGLENCLRLSIGDQLIMKRFWRIFETIPRAFLTNAINANQQITSTTPVLSASKTSHSQLSK